MFVVGAGACWLIASRRTPPVYRAVAIVAVGTSALVPLALKQRGNAAYVGDVTSLAERVAVVAKHLLVGYELPADRLVAAVVGLVLVASVVLVAARASRSEQRGVFLAATVGLAAVVVPVVLASMGLDYVNSRNALVGLVPLAIARRRVSLSLRHRDSALRLSSVPRACYSRARSSQPSIGRTTVPTGAALHTSSTGRPPRVSSSSRRITWGGSRACRCSSISRGPERSTQDSELPHRSSRA